MQAAPKSLRFAPGQHKIAERSVPPLTARLNEKLRRLNFRPNAVSQSLGRRRQGTRPLPSLINLGGWIEGGIISRGRRQQVVGGSIGGRGPGEISYCGRDLWAQQIIKKLVRKTRARALSQDDCAVAVKRKPFSRVNESKIRRCINRLLCRGRPKLGSKHIAGD